MGADSPLQRYRIIESLGAGGHGHTYRGVDLDTAREVAIKVFSLQRSDGWKSFDLFEREIDVLKTLDHPGIPKYIDSYASETSGDYFLVMELVDGRPLSAFVDTSSRLEQAKIEDVFDQMLEILEYLHSLSPVVIHRDIKPANIVLQPSGRVSLVDFGGVRRALADQRSSTVIGTFGYMAPEQLHGDATPGTDVYGLGATLAALLTGTEASNLPHEGLTLDVSRVDAAPALRRALQAMLQPDPSRRPRSVAAVRVLLEVAASSSTPPPATAAGRQARPSREGRRQGDHARTRSSEALANRQPVALDVSHLRPPLSILVWVATGLAWGGIVLFEATLMPLLYQLFTLLHRRFGSQTERAEFESEYRSFKGKVRHARHTMAKAAKQTQPGTDDDA